MILCVSIKGPRSLIKVGENGGTHRIINNGLEALMDDGLERTEHSFLRGTFATLPLRKSLSGRRSVPQIVGEKSMDTNFWLMQGVFVVIGLVALIGFFITKTEGYGRFATSTFLILIAIIVSSLLCSARKLDGQIMANIIFSVIGFAGGLFTGKDNVPGTTPNNATSADANKQGTSGTSETY
jgi:hypothetical protein